MKKIIRITALVLALLCLLPLSVFAAEDNPKEYMTRSLCFGSYVISDYAKFTAIVSELKDEARDELLSLYSEDFFKDKSLAMPEFMTPDISCHVIVKSIETNGNVITLTIDRVCTDTTHSLCEICYSHFFIPVSKNITEMRAFTESGEEVECVTLPMPSATLNFNEIEMICGDTAQLYYRIWGTYEWEFLSSDTSVATVDESGKITAVGEGEATITLKVENYAGTAFAECNVTVKMTFWQKVERFFNRVEAFFQKIISFLFK